MNLSGEWMVRAIRKLIAFVLMLVTGLTAWVFGAMLALHAPSEVLAIALAIAVVSYLLAIWIYPRRGHGSSV